MILIRKRKIGKFKEIGVVYHFPRSVLGKWYLGDLSGGGVVYRGPTSGTWGGWDLIEKVETNFKNGFWVGKCPL